MAGMDGVLIIDKPAGMTSHDVVARVRRITGQRRVGHTRTLDPFATGLLVLLLGRATRLLPYLDGVTKEYEATIALVYKSYYARMGGAGSADWREPRRGGEVAEGGGAREDAAEPAGFTAGLGNTANSYQQSPTIICVALLFAASRARVMPGANSP